MVQNKRGIMKEFTKDESKILKGIAILFMVGLHLFNRSDPSDYYKPILYIGNQPLIYYVSFLFDACVPIYCFCSGYALYLKRSEFNGNIKRIWNLLKRYWIILLLTILTGLITNSQTIPGNIFDVLGNITLIRLTYVGAWWFLQTYVLLVLLSPMIIKTVDHYKVTGLFSLLVYFVAYYFRTINPISTQFVSLNIAINAIVLLGTSQFPFIVGMLFYKYKIVTVIRKKIGRNNWIGLSVILVCILLHIVVKSMIVAPFIATLFICGFSIISFEGILKKILLYFGKHSTNIWLVHMQFYMIFASSIVFSTNTVVGSLVILLILCLLTSYIVDFLCTIVLKIEKVIPVNIG